MQKKPNIIIMYADDLGFGDVGCYGATSVPTPNIDRLGEQGLRFTQGYAAAATCTPSRYSLLTGSYPWRNPNAAILPGDAPMIIGDAEPTIASMLRDVGYHTGIVGKWHLGLGSGNLDWNSTIDRTPNDVGFEHSFILAATNDRVPCVYIQDRQVVGLDTKDPIEVAYHQQNAFPGVPTGRNHPESLRMMFSHGHDGTIVNGVSRIGEMRGGNDALWDDETMAETFASKACDFIRRSKDQPFFLYYSFHQPHVPRIPGPRFAGSTPHGPRGDVIAEMDWCVGQVTETLDELGIAEETVVIFTSDNGPVLDDGYEDRAEELVGGHKPAGPLRGGKYSMFDGGTRVPFVLSWPGTVKPDQTRAVVSQLDFFSSFASLVGAPMGQSAAPDSLDLLDAMLGRTFQGREEIVLEGMQSKTILRRENWTYIPPHDGPGISPSTHNELGNASYRQLYDLDQDIGQISNQAPMDPTRVNEMASRLQAILESTRTRP